jgi:hypothetical protein
MLAPRFPDRWDAEDELARARAELAYLRYLKGSKQKSPPDLIRYFAFDFFHDGEIVDIAFSPDLRTLEWRIQTTWLQPKDATRRTTRGYSWTWFKCVFEDVVWFGSTAERVDRLNDPLTRRHATTTLGSSEIDTLDGDLERLRHNHRFYLRSREATFHSLLIDLHPSQGRLGIIFRNLSVLPEEPLAWEQVVVSGEYDIPWCEPANRCLAEAITGLSKRVK